PLRHRKGPPSADPFDVATHCQAGPGLGRLERTRTENALRRRLGAGYSPSMVRHGGRIAVTALVASLLAIWNLGDEATAAGKPPFSAQINGRVFKANARNAQAVFVVDVVELVAHARKGRSSRAVAVACPALNLPSATLPVTLTSCNGTYEE